VSRNRFVDWNRQFRTYDVVLRIRIVIRIETKHFLRSFINKLRMKQAEFAVSSRITEVKSKLPGLHIGCVPSSGPAA
jgi:hypothetical protein